MPRPSTRSELCQEAVDAFEKLQDDLERAGPRAGGWICVDDWTTRDLLAVRCWWTERVVDWIEAGQRGEVPTTPAEGFRWNETPRLNASVVHAARRASYRSQRTRLAQGFTRVLDTIDSLSDRELLEVGVFEWAGSYPLSRWISINVTRQYATARTYLRRAIREESTR